ncbi:hypothetical protein O5541_05095 [Escherichia coli]|nr:hypothetical protein [Escherichia coli]
MIKNNIYRHTNIFYTAKRSQQRVETWIYQVGKRLSIPVTIACIRNEGYLTYTKVNDHCDIHYIGFSRVYKRLFPKVDLILILCHILSVFLNTQPKTLIRKTPVIVIHNSMKLYKQIRSRSPSRAASYASS